MRTCRVQSVVCGCVLLAIPGRLGGAPLGPAFTYQGRILENGVPVNDFCEFEFSLFEDAGGVTQVGVTQTILGVPVTNGLFTVELNRDDEFGATAFVGDERWLMIAVKCSPDASFIPLRPLQPVTPAPYALALPGLRTTPSGDASFPDSPNVIGGHRENAVGAGVAGATIGGGGRTGRGNSVTLSFGTIGGGIRNAAGGFNSTVGGGVSNTASGDDSTVGGGQANLANGLGSTLGGGSFNTASATSSTVGGGSDNIASGTLATVPGGRSNLADGDFSFAAGRRAKANHTGTFVWADSTGFEFASTRANQFSIRAAGGVRIANRGNGATLLELALERRWEFRQLGSGAGTALELASLQSGGISNKAFIINTTGRVGIGTTSPRFTLHVNGSAGKPGGGSWSNASDRRLKKNIKTLTGALDKLLALRGVTFEYKDPESIHELPGTRTGMVAQDVEAVMPDWVDEDADGYKRVTYRGFEALTVEAVRELRAEVDAEREHRAETDARMQKLRAENTALRGRLARLEELVTQRAGR